MSQLADQLNAAADIIERQGWAQYRGMTPDEGPKCLMGALGQALCIDAIDVSDLAPLAGVVYSYGALERTPAYKAVEEQVGKENIGGPHLFLWNDNANRTVEDVIGVLRAAAVIEEAREAERSPVPVG